MNFLCAENLQYFVMQKFLYWNDFLPIITRSNSLDMNHHILPKVDDTLKKYQQEHRGESPLYILVSPHEADRLLDEVRHVNGYDPEVLVTEYKGSKIVTHGSLNKGDLRLTNELPETSS